MGSYYHLQPAVANCDSFVDHDTPGLVQKQAVLVSTSCQPHERLVANVRSIESSIVGSASDRIRESCSARAYLLALLPRRVRD
jgi:hypothetical protein